MDEQTLINEGYKDGKKSFDYLWAKIAKGFDFGKVYKVMKALDWCWSIGEEDEMAIPRIDTIVKHASKLCVNAYDQNVGMTSTGGFSAGMEDGELWLSFSIEGAHTCDL